jgi:hypothetical protein
MQVLHGVQESAHPIRILDTGRVFNAGRYVQNVWG